MKSSPFWLLRRLWETKKQVGNVAEKGLSVISSLWGCVFPSGCFSFVKKLLLLFCVFVFVFLLFSVEKLHGEGERLYPQGPSCGDTFQVSCLWSQFSVLTHVLDYYCLPLKLLLMGWYLGFGFFFPNMVLYMLSGHMLFFNQMNKRESERWFSS